MAGAARRRRPGGQQGRGAVAWQPAAGAARGRAACTTRSCSSWTSRWPVWTRRESTRSARCSSSRPERVLRAVLQPPARPGRGSVRDGHDHRPRPPRRDRNGRRPGHAAARAGWSSGWRATATRPGRAASPASRSPRSIGGAARLVLDDVGRQRLGAARRPWPRAGSRSSPSSAAGCPRCSGRPWREAAGTDHRPGAGRGGAGAARVGPSAGALGGPLPGRSAACPVC